MVTYTPNQNYYGIDRFTFTVSDGQSTSEEAIVEIDILPINDSPVLDPENIVEPFSFDEDTHMSLFSIQEAYNAGIVVDIDNSLESLTFTLAVENENISLEWDGSISSNPTLTPNLNYHGPGTIEICVSDGEYTACNANNFTVVPVNDSPSIISAHLEEINEGHSYSYAIETHDIDGDAVSVFASTKPSWLTLENNVLSGSPESGHVGCYDVVLTANDGNGGTSSESFIITANATKTTIDGGSGFRMLSSPISGIGIYADLLDELWTQGIAGSDDPDNGGPNVWTWNDTSWQALTDLDSNYYHAGTGILVYVFADANFDGIEDDLPVDLSIDTIQISHDVDVPISSGEWSLVGNPYGVPMDITMMTERNKDHNNIRSAIHVYDTEEKQYKVHNGTIGEGKLASGHLDPFQAFWVHSPPDDKFKFKKNDRVMPGSGSARFTVDSTGSALIAFNSAGHSSSTYMSFDLYGQVGRDAADGLRLLPMFNQDHLISMFYMDDNALAINNLPYDFNADIAVDLDVMMLMGTDEGFVTTEEEVTMTWDFSQLPPGISMILMDNITYDTFRMNETNTYTFTVEPKGAFNNNLNTLSSYPSLGNSRFTIFMSSSTASGSEEMMLTPERLSLHPAYPNPFNPSTTIHYSLEKTSHVQLKAYDMMGREVSTLVDKMIIAGEHRLKWVPDKNLAAGIYVIRITNGGTIVNQKITFLK